MKTITIGFGHTMGAFTIILLMLACDNRYGRLAETLMRGVLGLAGTVTKLVTTSHRVGTDRLAPALIDGGSMLASDRADTAIDLVI